MSILGTRVIRTEDPRLLTSGGVYVDDLREPELAGAVRATFVRSPVAHALITDKKLVPAATISPAMKTIGADAAVESRAACRRSAPSASRARISARKNTQ